MRKATSSGSAAPLASPSAAPAAGSPGKAEGGGGAGPRPKRGGAWCGSKRRSQSAERSAASSTPPGKTCAPGMKPCLGERCSSRSRKPSAGDQAADPGCVQPAASTTEAARRQLLGLGRRGPLMAAAARGFRAPGSGAAGAPGHRPARPPARSGLPGLEAGGRCVARGTPDQAGTGRSVTRDCLSCTGGGAWRRREQAHSRGTRAVPAAGQGLSFTVAWKEGCLSPTQDTRIKSRNA
uniref:Uncharacterized protein n=1 Tax=Equus asinus asinus TaxID=83772 RepID=A0A8C4MS75_EQUAS